MELSTKRKADGKKKGTIGTEELINLVHQRKCLWDRNSHLYRDRTEKDKAWHEIYREIEPEFDQFGEALKNIIGLQITRKWYNIRDSYVKSKRPGLRSRPYLHARLLNFLEPIYFEKNLEASRCEDKSEGNEEEQWLNEVFVVDDEGEVDHSAKRTKIDYNDKTKESIEGDESIVNVLANLINREDDEDRAFFRSITPAVKRLSDDTKLEFRIQVLNLLKSLADKDKKAILCKTEERNSSEDD